MFNSVFVATPTERGVRHFRNIMKMANENVAETRALRDEYVRQFNYDSDAIFEDLMAKQAMHPERVVSLPPRKDTR